jgi:apoptosis-inducing factor 3
LIESIGHPEREFPAKSLGTLHGTKCQAERRNRIIGGLRVAGIGVRPRTQLAERAGLKIDRGIAVNAYLETSAPGIFAAGDVARWRDPHADENLWIEHWVVAERQGQTAARNILGQQVRFFDVPFFWSQHYDVPINYIGHAEKWAKIEITGDIEGRDCLVRYSRDGRSWQLPIFRDLENLKEEAVSAVHPIPLKPGLYSSQVRIF